MNEIHEIENTSLEAHVSLCAERYKNLDTRLNSVEKRLDKIESGLVEIKELLQKDKNQLNGKVIVAAGTVITILVSAIGFLLSHYVLK
jgi:tetrahydromethanopterin S-methyltransferase subunit G